MLRVGHIKYLNSLPIYYGLERELSEISIELRSGSPTELNSMVLNGDLDISPISSIEYCRNADELMLLPDICVSSDGEVKSILLSHIGEAKDISSVALSSSSASSHALVKIVLEKGYGLQPRYEVFEPNLDEMLKKCDAALLIGDDALELYLSKRRNFTDLGLEWKKLTSLPMVYAVWVVRRESANRFPDEVREMVNAFSKSIDYCYSHRSEVARRAAVENSFNEKFLYEYFGDLKFSLSSRYRRGMVRFFAEALEIGAVESVPELIFFE